MSNLPPGITQEMLDGHEHNWQCLEQEDPEAECICLEIEEARLADESDAMLDDQLLN